MVAPGAKQHPTAFLVSFFWISVPRKKISIPHSYNSVVFSTASANQVTFNQMKSAEALESIVPDIWNPKLYANISSKDCSQRYSAQLFSSHGSGWGLLDPAKNASMIRESPDTNWSGNKTGFGNFGLRDIYLCKSLRSLELVVWSYAS